MENNTKPFWASKTLWANFVAFLVVVSTAFGFDLGLDPDSQLAVVGGVMAVVNVALRLMTTQPLE